MEEEIKVGAKINGLTTYNSYLVVAVTKAIRGKNAFGVRYLGGPNAKVHYWPSAEAFKLIPNPGHEDCVYKRDSAGHSIGTYEGVSSMPWDQVGRLLGQLRKHDDFEVMSAKDYQAHLQSIGQARVRTGAALVNSDEFEETKSTRPSNYA